MNQSGTIINQLTRLVELFLARCSDTTTLNELAAIIEDRGNWAKGHDLFQRIRRQTLAAERTQDSDLVAQYYFEEMCAKTIYNLSGRSAPFDSDSPYWIVPAALSLARTLHLGTAPVLAIVSPGEG